MKTQKTHFKTWNMTRTEIQTEKKIHRKWPEAISNRCKYKTHVISVSKHSIDIQTSTTLVQFLRRFQ